MRSVILIFLMLFAVPALAQQEPECRGKKGFKLGDGAYGCLIGLGEGNMTKSTRRESDPDVRHSSSQFVAVVDVNIFGNYDKSRRVTNSRVRQICKAFSGDVKTAMVGKPYLKVIVRMFWPRIAAPKKQGSNTTPLVQEAYMSQKCTNVGHFSSGSG